MLTTGPVIRASLSGMDDLAAMLSADRLVDLTQPLGPATTQWPVSTPFIARTLAGYETEPG